MKTEKELFIFLLLTPCSLLDNWVGIFLHLLNFHHICCSSVQYEIKGGLSEIWSEPVRSFPNNSEGKGNGKATNITRV